MTLKEELKACPGLPFMEDLDGNVYATVKICTQCWMQSNLKVSKYRNGDAIPTGLSDFDWVSTKSGAYAIYDNRNANDGIYGKLYNWYAINDVRGLCSTGWRVPNDAEWTILTDYLGGLSVAGGRMKSVGTTYWNSPNTGATNESGFSVLPGGYRNSGGSFYNISSVAFFWSATESGNNVAGTRSLNYGNGYVSWDQ